MARPSREAVIFALRCSTTPGGPVKPCGTCPYNKFHELTEEEIGYGFTEEDAWT